MRIVNIHEAKTNFSRLVDAALQGEQVTIAKAGKPVVKLVPVGRPEAPPRTGFLQGQGRVPDDFDSMFADEIADWFEGRP